MSFFGVEIHIYSVACCEYEAAGTLEEEVKSLVMLQYLSVPRGTYQAVEKSMPGAVKCLIPQHEVLQKMQLLSLLCLVTLVCSVHS